MTALLLLITLAPAQPHYHPCSLTTYASRFEGRRTASGARFTHRGYTCASRSLPLGSRIVVRYWSGRRWRSVVVTVTDRGRLPLHRRGRIQLDITKAAAKKLGLYRRGADYRRGEWRVR